MTAPAPAEPADRYVVGIDFGTLSGRAVVVRVSDGTELGSAVHDYPHGVMDRTLATTGAPLPPGWALQVPADYVEVLREAVPAALGAAGVDPAAVIGIGTDFTACTVLPTTVEGTALCELPELSGRPHAYAKLWRHHAAQPHADRINALAETRDERWLSRYGGRISSEWEFAKGLQLLEEDPEIYHRMDHWVEQPTGSCGSSPAATSATPAPPATRRSTKVRGRRRRHRDRAARLRGRPVRRRRHLRLVRQQPTTGPLRTRGRSRRHQRASAPHRARRPRAGGWSRAGSPGLALRKPLRAGRPRVERAGRRADAVHPAGGGLPGAAGGDRLRHPHHRRGVPRPGRCGLGVRRRRRLVKNRVLMQIYADVLRMPISVLDSDQGPALGSAIHAAVAAGAYPDVRAAAEAMGRVQHAVYRPDEASADAYDLLYNEYQTLHDHFGRGGNDVMHRLRTLQAAARDRAETRP